jgi:uncharacterized membrane protein YeaQ/YmgE (transglycosylase-associated protein family)
MTHLLLYSLPPFIEEHRELIVTILIGALAGYIAQFIVPGRGFGLLVTILIGIAGGWVGNRVLGGFLHLTHDPLFDEIICATLGAMILVLVINLIVGIPKGVTYEKDVYDWENE